ncbi:leucyl aminopeptidase [bacterium]|nr:leucyl aminopeptidase [bacterium]QQR58352.1 MAG: leucyl aminopeptidase [Candidatus Melainabacteria bacterium]
MKFVQEKSTLSSVKTDILVMPLRKNEKASQILKETDKKFPQALALEFDKYLQLEGFKGSLGEIVMAPSFGQIPASRILFIGLGDKEDTTSTRRAFASVSRRLKLGNGHNLANLAISLPGNPTAPNAPKASSKTKTKASKAIASHAEQIRHEDQAGAMVAAMVEGLILGSFDFDKYKTVGKKAQAQKSKTELKLSILGQDAPAKTFSDACQKASAIGEATNFARQLIAEPPVFMTPSRLSTEAKRIAKENGLTCRVMDVPELEKMGMGSFLGVARGADEPPKFIVMKYSAGSNAKKTVALVGKGITFDSGGLSLKPSLSMEHMKYDMSGAAAVIACMQVIGELKPDVNVLGIVAACENMPSGKALHPGDVITAMNGKTIEVNNTDAEGRLILADALCFAVNSKVDEIIDVATLTGAIVQALGRVAGGVMGNNQNLMDKLLKASESAGEKLWQLPMYDDYKDFLKSDIADLKNAGSRGEAGSSCAAMFLKEFVSDSVAWAHLDIAGAGWSDKPKGEVNKGGTAFGVRTICHYLTSLN